MSRWEIATWISIAVLVPGSIAVFVWFLADVRRVYRKLSDRDGELVHRGDAEHAEN